MTTGLRVPVGVGNSGGAAIERDDSEQMGKILFLAFSEQGDHNPFQSVGLLPQLLFSLNNASVKAKAEQEVMRVLNRFSEVIELAPDEQITIEQVNEGEVEVSFSYVFLPTGKIEEFRRKFLR